MSKKFKKEVMKRKLYAQTSKVNAKRFREAKIQDQLTEIEDILDVFHGACCNVSRVLPTLRIDESNNVQDNNLIVKDVLVRNLCHETEDAEYSEHNSSDELEDEIKCDIEYLRDRLIHDIEAYLLNFLTEWGIRDISFKKVDKLLAGLRVFFPGLPKSYKTIVHSLRTVNVKEVGQGIMWYKSIKINFDEILTDDYLQKKNQIVVDINIDSV
ncbi:uncharacterized protein LOC115233602 [Formica exsecta]|uniref:uncharacterized protein LOC115233602 n=1 Tax=Formica exsecta TaxID=72781 RepID=UPI00114447F7|nr:uncharacterized protein LOC115233602 [Formica exsecta]